MDKHTEKVVRTANVIGKHVNSTDLENLGTIKEIVLDKISGQARYIVLAFGGFLGLGEDYFAFPWKAISYQPSEDCFILQISKDQLKKNMASIKTTGLTWQYQKYYGSVFIKAEPGDKSM